MDILQYAPFRLNPPQFGFYMYLNSLTEWRKFLRACLKSSNKDGNEGKIGNPVYPPARRKLAEHGISCEGKAARRLTNADYDQYDLLIGMDWANLRNMRRICGGDFAGKRHLLKDYTDHPGDVADPWYTDDFDTTWWDVLAGCKGLLQAPKMQPGTGKRNTAA